MSRLSALLSRETALAWGRGGGPLVSVGFYAGVAVAMLPVIATPSGTATFWSAGLASLGALGLVAAALWLEHICRLPLGPDDPRRDRV